MTGARSEQSSRIDEALGRIRRTIETRLPDVVAASVRYLDGGLEFDAFLAERTDGTQVVIKASRTRWVENDNDRGIDSRELLVQEKRIADHCRLHRFPVPEAFEVIWTDENHTLLVSAFVESDGAPADDHAFGAAVGLLHAMPLPGFATVALPNGSGEEILAKLIVARAEVVSRLGKRRLPPLDPKALQRALSQAGARRALLHMDARPANFLAKNGNIAGVIDWSNALIADPMIEIMRIDEFGLLNDRVISGYRSTSEYALPPKEKEIAYRLYTATMLGVVFLSEQPCEERGRSAADRVEDLMLGFRSFC